MSRDSTAPTTYADAQSQLRALTYERALIGAPDTRTERKRAGVIDQTIAALNSVFKDLSLTADYSVAADTHDETAPAPLFDLPAFANSIPIAGIGPSGSNPSPMPSDATSP